MESNYKLLGIQLPKEVVDFPIAWSQLDPVQGQQQ